MKCSECKVMFTAIAVALMAAVAFCVFTGSDESSADSSGNILGPDSSVIGTYSLDGYTLTLEATSVSAVTTVILENFTEQDSVQKIIVKNFVDNISGSFIGYENLDTIEYQGSVSTGGSWTFEFFTGAVTITAKLDNTAEYIQLNNFNMQPLVTSVIIKGYVKNLSSSFTAYSSLDGNITYLGTFSGTYGGGQWEYSLKTKTLIVDKSSTSTGSSPGSYSNTSAPFLNMFFKDEAENAIYKTFTANSSYLFYGLSSLKSFRATEYVEYNSYGILYGMTALEELRYDSITQVERNTVSQVKATLKVFTADNATKISNRVFFEAYQLATINAPKVTSIDEYAFSKCTSLANVNLRSCTTIENHAFNECTSLRDITLPVTTSLKEYAFYGCTSLRTVSFESQVSIGNNAFERCNNLMNITSSNIASIGYDAFSGCSSLYGEEGTLTFTYLTLIQSSSSQYPFRGCTSIIRVEMPAISTMEPYAFYGCESLTTVSIGNHLGEIPDHAFAGCNRLNDLTLGDDLIEIGEYAFEGCTALNGVILPGSLESIRANAFKNSGINSLNTNNVTEIGANAFQGCNITLLVLGTAITTIGSGAFNSSGITGTLTFPTSISSIGDGAFAGTQMGAITFSNTNVSSYYSIGNNAFQGCSKLVTVVLGDRVETIGNEAFYGCPMLVNMTYGSNLKSIGDRAFNGCNSLSSELTISSKIEYLGTDAFKGTSIRGLEFDENSKLTSISNGAFQDCRSLRRVIEFPNSIQTIGSNTFNNSTIRGITFDVATSKLTSIGDNAFRGCSSLAGDLALPLNVTTIGTYAFYGCGITSLSLGANIQNLGTYAFANNAGLTEVIIPNTISNLSLSERLFFGCMLTNIYISSSVNNIGPYAFSCTNITASEVNVWFNGPMTGITISNNAFEFNNTAIMNVYADPSSEDIAKALKTSGKAIRIAGVTYIQKDQATVGFKITNATPMYNTITALYDSKIVLPYYRAGDTYGTVCYSVADNTPTYLSVFASEADYENDRIARSGDVVRVFPYMNGDRISMQGSADTSEFVKDMVIMTDSGGLDVNILSQTVHYGGTIVVPQFIQSDLIHLTQVTLQLSDGTGSYQFPPETVSLYAGFHFSTIVLDHEDVYIDVLFIKQFGTGEPIQQTVQVKLREPFYVPDAVLWMEEAPAGYEYYGWWDAPMNIEGTGGVKAIEGVTPFDWNEEWYVHYKPLEYTLTMTNTADTPPYSGTWTMYGPYQLHVVGKSLYYTDAKQTSNKLLFDENSVPGWSVNRYEDSTGRAITGDSAVMTGDNAIYLRMQMNQYDFTLKFYVGGVEVSPSETFIINGWAIGEGTEYHSGSVIEDVSYSFIENGLNMPVPINQTYAFNSMAANDVPIPSHDGTYTLTLAYFDSPDSITIRYNMDEGVYTVQFVMNDDASTVFTSGPYHIGEDVFLRASDYYTKVGYQFTYYSIPGGGVYSDGVDVAITPEMVTSSTYCVITVTANWTPIQYTVSFDLSPFEGTVPSQTVVNGGTVTIPDVSANHGYRPASWYWFKDATQSEPFTTDTELTSDIITTYADGQNIRIGVNWALKEYRLNVAGSPGYPEITGAKLGDTITLWVHTYTPDFKEFAGWAVGSESYPEGEPILFDMNMATTGDLNSGTVSFQITWNDIRYHVQYNPNGGQGTTPVDENEYVIGDPFTIAPVDESVFYNYGYTFVGWKYSLDGDVIFDGDKFTEELARNAAEITHAVTFYAVWAQKSYKINYELEGGRYGTSAPTNVRYGDPVTIDNPTRVGYRFEGWTAVGLTSGAKYLSKSGMFMTWNGSMVDSTVYKDLTDKSTDKVIATVTLTAHWAEASYTTEYLPNGGTWTSITSSQYQISIGDVIELPTVRDAKKTGYTFSGWGIDTINTIPSGTRLTEAMISDPNKFTLYAIWTPVVYQLQYRYTDDYQYSTVNVDYGSSAYVPILDRAGYTFRGWTITGAGLEAEYSRDNVEWYKLGSSLIDGTYFRNMSSEAGGIVTMDAEWNSIEYRLSYNTNGGTGKAPVDSNSYRVGDPVVMKDYKDLIGTNGSKVIIGWSLEINGSAVNVNEFTQGLCTMADATNTVNFYGVWVNDMCTVVVDLEGCSASSIPAGWVKNADGTYEKLVNYGTETKDALADWDDVVLSKDGYNFAGWDYDTSTVMSTVTAYPTFDKVNMSIMYVFGGIIGVFVVAAIVFARR